MPSNSQDDACAVIRREIAMLKEKDAVLREWEMRLEADLVQVQSVRQTLMATISGLTKANVQLGS